MEDRPMEDRPMEDSPMEDSPMEDRLANLVREHARDRPSAPALTCGPHTLTYAELDERSNRVARGLSAQGVRPGSRIGHLDKNALEFFELLFGAVKIGAVLVEANWRLTAREIGGVLADADVQLLVVGEEFVPVAAEIEAQLPVSCRILAGGGVEGRRDDRYEGYETWLAAQRPTDPGFEGSPGDVVMQLYTSGTTGAPKGVQLTNSNLGALQEVAPQWGVDEATVSLVAMPLFHIGGSGWALVGLRRGGRNVLVREIDPAALLDTIEEHRVTNAFLVPAVLRMLTAVPGAAERDYSSLRSIIYGASPITSDVLRAAVATFRCPLFQVYGLTETTGAITQLEPEAHDPEGPRAHLMRSAGRPYPWVELTIADPATEAGLPPGQVGEVWTRSPQNTAGYWRKPEETAAAITPEGWLRTGDAGYLDEEGYLFLTDRIKDMIISGAENVYPIEVEEVLAGHPDIAEVAVIGVPDDRFGEAVKAIVVPRPAADLGEEGVIAYARERLAGFKRPRSVDFVDELPRNLSGKVLKKELRTPYWGAQKPT